jgi:HD-like signal output (HDOD) protein
MNPSVPDQDALRQELRSHAGLPTLPPILLRVLETVSDPNSSALDLARIILPDQSLSAAVLRLVNSAAYGFRRRITSVPEAIALVGFAEVRNLSMAATAVRRFGSLPGHAGAVQLWRHALASALAADQLQGVSPFRKTSFCAFSAGLLHDIGKLPLGMLYPEAYSDAVAAASAENAPLYEVEPRFLHMDHAAAGGILAEEWNLPAELVVAIRGHHAPTTPEAGEEALPAHFSAAANWLAYQFDLPASVNAPPPARPAGSLEALGIDEAAMGEVEMRLRGLSQRVDVLFGVIRG